MGTIDGLLQLLEQALPRAYGKSKLMAGLTGKTQKLWAYINWLISAETALFRCLLQQWKGLIRIAWPKINNVKSVTEPT
jgi:hypothetical protein